MRRCVSARANKTQQTRVFGGSGYRRTESNTGWRQTNTLGVYTDEIRTQLTKCLGTRAKGARTRRVAGYDAMQACKELR